MTRGTCQWLGCYDQSGFEFLFEMDASPRLVLICEEHRGILLRAREMEQEIMVTPTTFGLGATRGGGTVWVMPPEMKTLWWPPDPRATGSVGP